MQSVISSESVIYITNTIHNEQIRNSMRSIFFGISRKCAANIMNGNKVATPNSNDTVILTFTDAQLIVCRVRRLI